MKWTCPNCQTPLQRKTSTDRQLKCEQGHCFDIAKQGYINLLLDTHKNSKIPGDNAQMLDARRRLLQSDTYKPLVAELNTLIQPQDTIADLGCGEGFYLAAIAEAHPEIRGFGLDIAKHGIKKAAATYKNPLLEFAVASTYRIPIQSTSTSLALSIFAPFCPQETQRILTPEGRLIRVSPGPTHLCEIKSHLYEKAEVHSKPEPALGFILEYEKQVTWSATLTGGTIVDDLIPMTPLHWQGSTESKEKLREQDLEITFDFYVECFVISANNTDKEN